MSRSSSAYSNVQAPDMDEVKESVRQVVITLDKRCVLDNRIVKIESVKTTEKKKHQRGYSTKG